MKYKCETIIDIKTGEPVEIELPDDFPLEEVKKSGYESGKRMKDALELLVKDVKIELTEEQREKFRQAAEILVRNKKDCEQFKGRDGI